MKAMVLNSITDLDHNSEPLEYSSLPKPVPADYEVLIKVQACGVCHTELDEIEGRTLPAKFPIVPGHQVVGIVESTGKQVTSLKLGARVGVAWIFSSCGKCSFCLSGRENLCRGFIATGRDVNGGYAEYMTVPESFAYAIPPVFSSAQAAPLLCAGAVGYRSLKLSGIKDGWNIGLSGFGASAHLVLQIIKFRFPKTKIFVFARSENERSFARELGAFWTGDITDNISDQMDSIIDTTPVWKPVIDSLKKLKAGGRLIINAIRKEESDKTQLLNLDFAEHLWMEKEIKSVANVTRNDVIEFLSLAAEIPVLPEIQEYKLEDANIVLAELKQRKIRGAKVLVME
ncbi:MAG: zinc-dependent alcohol dehydrogenase family protein [Bacteroidales bacterium]